MEDQNSKGTLKVEDQNSKLVIPNGVREVRNLLFFLLVAVT